jgi:hypothetical protein
MICEALKISWSLQAQQGNYSDTLPFAEEYYNLVVEAYDPVHL